MSLPASGADVPVVCTKSGVVMVLEAVLVSNGHRQDVEHRLDVDGFKARFPGRCCLGCSFPVAGVGPSCEYRPLVGPLFVPRAT